MTLEQYLKAEYAEGKIDFAVRVSVFEGTVELYIHPAGRDGMTTPPLIVKDNTVQMKYGTSAPGWEQS